MDEEEREALKLSREDLLAREARGKPARLARKRKGQGKEDVNTAAARIVREATASPPIRVTGEVRLFPERSRYIQSHSVKRKVSRRPSKTG